MEIKFRLTPEEVRVIVKEYILTKYPIKTEDKEISVDDGYNYNSFVIEITDRKEEEKK